MEVWFHVFLTSTLDGGEWSALLPEKETKRLDAPPPPNHSGCCEDSNLLSLQVTKRRFLSHPACRRSFMVSSFILLPLVNRLTSGWQLLHQNPCEPHLDYSGSSCEWPESAKFWICCLHWVYHSRRFSLACCVSSCHTEGYCT